MTNFKTQQQRTLSTLLREAENTQFGRRYNFRGITSYDDFKEQVPLCFYENLAEYVDELKQGSPDILWPGMVDTFAVSSGTTGSGTHLPLTKDRLNSDKKFMRMVAISYLKQQPNILPLLGKHLSLPGSIDGIGNLLLGEISGFTACQVPFWLAPFQLIPPRRLTALSFKEKFERVIGRALKANITVITAVPSWILTLFQQALQRSGKETVAGVWPNLKLLVCGGVKLSNYRHRLEQLAGKPELDFIETYGASEGYFAFTDDLNREDLKLVTDNGIFYEFIPDPMPDEPALSIQPAVPLSEVEPGVPYAMLVSTNAGLWRYAVRDVVEFTSADPPRIIVKGRISEMLDDFGEALYIYEAENALNDAAAQLELETGAFTIAAVLDSKDDLPRHHWYVQFFEPVHTQTLQHMAGKIDQYLQKINRHYAIRRKSQALDRPVIHSIRQADINNWLEANGKDKAQGKLPRILKSGATDLHR